METNSDPNNDEPIASFYDLEFEFATTTIKIKKALINSPDIDVTSVVEQLQTFSAVKNNNIPLFNEDVFEKVTTTDKLWNKFWSIFNYDVLIILLKLVKCKKADEIFKKFLSRFDISTFEDMDLMLDYKIYERQGSKPWLRIKVKTEKCTILIKRKVEETLSLMLNLKGYFLYFKGVKEGCAELVYEISNAMMSYFSQCKFSGYDLAKFSSLIT